MKTSILLTCTNLIAAVLPMVANAATVLTFDDLPVSSYYSIVPNGYGGLQWYEFGIIDPQNYPMSPGGYLNGMVSARNVAFNAFGTSDGAMRGSIYLPTSRFDLNSAYLTAAWNDGLQMTALGFVGGSLTYSNTYTLTTTSPTLIDFNFLQIDRVDFISSGGTPHGYNAGGTQVAFDNLAVTVPEPASAGLLGLGAALIYVVPRRRKGTGGGARTSAS
jgi:hypothetical protein